MSVAIEQAAGAEPGPAASRPVRTTLRALLFWPLMAAVAAVAAAVWLLQAWDMALHVPISQSGDGSYQLMLIRTVLDQGWLGVNHAIGAPYGGVLQDHTAAYGDSLQLLVIKLMSLGSSDPAAILNVYYVLGYGAIAAVSCAILQRLGFGGAVSASCSVVYSLLQYHFFRGESNLFLGTYFSVPIACWLVLSVMGHRPLFERRTAPRHRLLAWTGRATLITLAACAIVGTSDVYYAIFTVALVGSCGLVRGLATRAARQVVPALAVCAAVLAAAVLVQIPTIVYHAQHGKNPVVGHRLPSESETYALKLTNLVIPSPDHRSGLFRHIATTYYDGSPQSSEVFSPGLGTTMTIGLAVVLLAAAAAAAGGAGVGRRALLLRDSGVASAIALVLATTGGVSALIAYYVSPQIRAWNRISVFIAFFAIIGVAVMLERLMERAARGGAARSRGLAVAAVVLVGLPLFAMWDQSGRHSTPNYAGGLINWRNDGRFVAQADALLPPHAAVLQLPYVPFPESPPVERMQDYDELKGYVHGGDLRWSYGAIKGRDPDQWGAAMAGVPMRQLVPAAAAADFKAIYVDRFGYADNGAAVIAELTDAIGRPPVLTSADGRLELFDLAPVSARLTDVSGPARRLGAAALVAPLRSEIGDGFYTPAESDGKHTWYWARAKATITLANDAAFPRGLDVRFELHTPGTTPSSVTVTLPGGGTREYVTEPGGYRRVRLRLRVPPGGSSLRFTTPAPDEAADVRDLRLQLRSLTLTDDGYTRLAGEAARP